MTGEPKSTITFGLVLGMVIVCSPAARAQFAPAVPPGSVVAQTAAVAAGRLDGMVTDERGTPLLGVAITAQGAGLQFAVTDERGRFAFNGLKPGPYLVRAVLPGYATSRRELVQVLPAAAAWQAFRLSKLASAEADLSSQPVEAASFVPGSSSGDASDHGHDSIAWRLRHLKRSVLREEGSTVVDPEDSGATDERAGGQTAQAFGSQSLSVGWLPALPISGQVQLLTSSSFDSPGQLFSEATVPTGMAYFAIGAPAGSRASWSAKVAIAQGELSSWALSGTYESLLGNGHALEVGWAHGWQRYEGSNPLALAAVALGDRSAGALTVAEKN